MSNLIDLTLSELVTKIKSKEMGQKGIEFVKEEFNWEKVAKNFLEIIKPFLK